MGQSALKSLCGKNLGYFPDARDSPPNSDDENEDRDSETDKYMPKGWGAYKREKKSAVMGHALKKLSLAREDAIKSGRGWGPFLVAIEVNGTRQAGIRACHSTVTPAMLGKLKSMGSLHVLEITYSHLKDLPPISEIEGLVILQLSHNSIRYLVQSEEDTSSNVMKLEKFICDWNKVESIAPGVFSGSTVAALQAINLAHNEIHFLPRDFGSGATRLQYLDLSYNHMTHLPEGLPSNCKRLQLLHIQKNDLRSLPPDIGLLKDLRKLFLSHNRLKDVPESIGNCMKLEKVRLIGNEIRFLPDSFINLWNMRAAPYFCNGCLTELLVDGNPLVQPSITAFEMGGADGLQRAMKLFWEWLEERKIDAAKAKALEEAKEEQGDVILSIDPATSRAATDTGRLSVTGRLPGSNRSAEKAAELQLLDSYYFPELKWITEVRNAQSKIARRKKATYLDKQRLLAMDLKGRSIRDNTLLPEHMREFAVHEFDPTRFRGRVPAGNLDLYICLLIFVTRPLYATCAELFMHLILDPDAQGNVAGTLDFAGLTVLCAQSGLTFPAEIKRNIWDLLSETGEGTTMIDFMAFWQLHDLVNPDKYVKRLVEVQQLEYYDLSMEELRARLRIQGATEAATRVVSSFQLEEIEAAAARKALVDERAIEGAEYIGDSDQFSRASDSELSEIDAVALLKENELVRFSPKSNVFLTGLNSKSNAGGLTFPGFKSNVAPNPPKRSQKTLVMRRPRPSALANASESGFVTDMHEVHATLREASRNMPEGQYKRMVNFLARGTKKILDISDQITYWHVHEPSFQFATGVGALHSSAEKVLIAMGFVCVAKVFWVWPEKHLATNHDWGYEFVPPDCPGLSEVRLRELVGLLGTYQRRLTARTSQSTTID